MVVVKAATSHRSADMCVNRLMGYQLIEALGAMMDDQAARLKDILKIEL